MGQRAIAIKPTWQAAMLIGRAIAILSIGLLLGGAEVSARAICVVEAETSSNYPATPVYNQQPAKEDSNELKQGQPVEREIKAGETHSYRIALKANQFINVVVGQEGINVGIELSDPAGQQIASLDWWWREGRESLWGLAETAGDYLLKVTASARPDASGKYEVRIEKTGELQQASPADRDYVTAHKTFAEAERLLAQPSAESQRKAAEKYQSAIPLWRRLKDGDAEAHTLNQMGVIGFRTGNLKQAAEYLDQAVTLFSTSRNQRGGVNSLTTLSNIYNFSGETQKAIDNYSRVLPLARAIKDYRNEAGILAGLGMMLHRSGQTTKALETLNELVSSARANGYLDGEAVAHNNIGLIYVGLGRLRDAVKEYSQTLALTERSGDRFGQSTTLNNIGNAYARMGEFQKAIEFLWQGLSLKRSTGDRRGEAANLGSIGNLYLKLGDYEKARQYYDQSLALSRALGNRDFETAALSNLGVIHGRTGELQKAFDYANQALALRVQLKDRSGEAYDLTTIGYIYSNQGEWQKALNYYDRALTIRREVGDQYGEPQTLLAISAASFQLGNRQMAREHLIQALTLTRATGDRLGEATTLFQLARVERDGNNAVEARSYIEEAIEIAEAVRARVTLSDVRAIYFASRQELYDFYIDLLMQAFKLERDQKYLADALRANERRTARNLLDSLAEAQADIRGGITQELVEYERRLQQDLNTKVDQQIRLLSRKHTAEQAAALAKEMESFTTEYEQALAQIRQSSPRYAALTQPAPLSLEEIQNRILDSNTLLLEYKLGDERSYLWAITRSSITGYELAKRKEIEPLARRVYESLTSRSNRIGFETVEERRARIAKEDADYEQAARSLSRMLLGPVAAQMKGKRLLVVADGALHYLPFAALPLPDLAGQRPQRQSFVPLVVEHEIVSLPSASALAVLRKEIAGRKPAPKAIAVLADPVFSNDDERLRPFDSDAQTKAEAARTARTRGENSPEPPLTRAARDFAAKGKELHLPRLPFTRQEAEAIVKLAPEGHYKKALDFAASKDLATHPELGQYRYLHFATHALLNSTNPGLSGIVLSLVDERGADREGFLLAHEIYNLKLPADLIVLSSCKTGLGKEVKGEGIIGITRGFMYAGAARVAVSLWDVDDESTAEMMKRFYAAMLGKQRLTPAAALRLAQVSMWKSSRWRSPYFWAAFVLQGEYK